MSIHVKFTLLSLCLAALLAGNACNDNGSNPADNFDRKAMLKNYADSLIRPAYADLKYQAELLNQSVESFLSNPSNVTLGGLQTAWGGAYLSWQFANAYNFGPAGEEGLKKGLIEEIGTFPVSETKIENAIAAGAWNLQDFNRDARGLLAIEYLIFGKNQSYDDITAAFNLDPKRRDYLRALAADLRDRTAAVSDAWNGAYYNEFIENAGTDVGSSTSALYNEFVRSYETIKNFKLGLPLGKRAGQTQAEPQLVEAYYSRVSLTVMQYHFSAIENIWHGRSRYGSDGIGFKEYLENVEGGATLIADTEAQMAAVQSALDNVPANPPLSELIETGNLASLDALHTELSQMTRYVKSDMSSLLGIAITFSSGDGD